MSHIQSLQGSLSPIRSWVHYDAFDGGQIFPLRFIYIFIIDSWSVEHLLNRCSNIFRHNKTRWLRNSGTSGKQTEGTTSTCTWINLKAFDPCQNEESVSQAELMSWWKQTKKCYCARFLFAKIAEIEEAMRELVESQALLNRIMFMGKVLLHNQIFSGLKENLF